MTQLITIRKGLKIRAKDIPLNARTIQAIESGNELVSIKSFRIYLNAIGLDIAYSLK